MTAFKANLLNALILLVVGTWGALDAYNSSGTEMSLTAFIPIIFGLIFLISSPWMAKENKSIAHLVVILTFLLLVSLVVRPLRTSEGVARIRVIIEALSCLVAMIFFIKSFIDARKKRLSGS